MINNPRDVIFFRLLFSWKIFFFFSPQVTAALLIFYGSIMLSAKLIEGQCNYNQNLIPGTTYYIYNPNYPYSYRGSESCVWTVSSDYRVNLTCTDFEIPWSYNCFQDSLTVQINSTTSHRYCGDGGFNVVSSSNSMVVTLSSPIWSQGGRFLCEIRAVKRPQDSTNCQCGWNNPSRIVGGMDTGVNEFPMMAGIVDADERAVFCGSTIISVRYVLTAAHCMTNRNYTRLGVLVGDHDISSGTDTNATMLYRVKKVIVHPNYAHDNFNDVALLKTRTKMEFGNEVGPACLPFQHSPDTFAGSFVQLLGWGTTSFGGPPSDILQKVTVSVLTNLQCTKFYPDLTPQQMCTYAKDKDACQMDSGGPVLWQNPTTKRFVLVGIISMGIGCGDTAGVNTRVGAYIDWIVSETADSTYCIIE